MKFWAKSFIKENGFENAVCKITTILSGPQYVNKSCLFQVLSCSVTPLLSISIKFCNCTCETLKLIYVLLSLVDSYDSKNCFECLGLYHYPLAFQAEGVLPLHASVHPSVRKLHFVRMITHHRFDLESPNLRQTCIMGSSQLVLKMEVIDLDPPGHFSGLIQNSRKSGLST